MDPIVNCISRYSGLSEDKVISLMISAADILIAKDPELKQLDNLDYRIPPTHMPWKHYKAHMFHGKASIEAALRLGEVVMPDHMSKLTHVLQSVVTHSNVVHMAARHGYPFWLVSNDLCDMLALTDSLADPNVDTEARPPFAGCHFLPPIGAIQLPDGDVVTMIGVSVLTLNDIAENGFAAPEGLDPNERRFYVTSMTQRGACYYCRLPIAEDGTVADPSTQEFTMYSEDGSGKVKDEGGLGQACANLVVGWALRFLIVLNAEPELMEGEITTGRRKAKKGRRALEFRDPRWLGRKVVWVRPKATGNGTHASPTTHWRRGHMARRRCGKGRADVRIVRIKPVLVNGPREREGVGV